MNNDKKNDHPGVKTPPPLIYFSFVVLGWWLDDFLPVNFGVSVIIQWLGLALVFVAGLVLVLILFDFTKAKTAVEPWKPASQLLTSGWYAYSRNPIYICFSLGVIGLGIFQNNLGIILSFIPSCVLTYQWVIKKEEAYLKRRFGEAYISYKQQVRRWL